MLIDRTKQAQDLLIQQYKCSPNLNELVAVFCDALTEVNQTYCDLLEQRSLDKAQGVMLDILGVILGFTRPLVIENPDDVFTTDNPADLGKGFGAKDDPQVGGRFIGRTGTEGFVRETDLVYRRRLKAQVIRNGANGSINSLIKYIKSSLNFDVTIQENVGYINLTFTNFLTDTDVAFIRQNLPVAAGIEIRDINIPTEQGQP